MAKNFYLALKRIEQNYDGNAARIWNDHPSSAQVVYRFLEFDGIGPKIATMAVNILAREFKVPFSDYFSIDISADVHVRRVFSRLKLVSPDPTVEQVVYSARSIWPEYPGIFDLPVWEIGRNWCAPTNPKCEQCYMRTICPSAEAFRALRNSKASVGTQ
jgi:endonuclease III